MTDDQNFEVEETAGRVARDKGISYAEALHEVTGPLPDPDEPLERVRQQINRYFVGLYGEDYTYRAPETFPNQLEVWMLLVCSRDITAADEQMEKLERMIKEGKRGKQ